MIQALQNHPFAVEAYFETSLVLTYAVPKEELSNLIPACLELDTYQDRWAFVAVALVQTRNLRPKGFPAFMGNDFFLIGCRIFVRYTNSKGKRLRGLYILKSETNKKKMEVLGNIFTHYSYTTTDIEYLKKGESITISSRQSELALEVRLDKHDVKLPPGSPFNGWKEARRFAGPLPFTFTYKADTKEVLIIEGVRQHWIPQAVEVVKSNVGFIDKLGLKEIVLANAFVIEQIPYYWKKGLIEAWKQ